ncbi:MAG TPA: DUF2637 domain-containing protein, partial [Streptosporangiaceae bacterium]|nr:DUF2637 domain-containing protein [Streptosporangiaceae bacterium]
MPPTSEYPAPHPSSPGPLQPRLGLLALSAVIVGVVLLAAAAFVLSYPGIHRIALQAGVSSTLAVLYPLIIDALLVSAGASLLAMRNAGWWTRCYVWLCLLLLLAVAGTGSAVHAMGLALPRQATRAGVAATPWVLLLLGFGLWLVMLRYLRQARRAMREAARAGVNHG